VSGMLSKRLWSIAEDTAEDMVKTWCSPRPLCVGARRLGDMGGGCACACACACAEFSSRIYSSPTCSRGGAMGYVERGGSHDGIKRRLYLPWECSALR
jgi:hypothetical protein